MRPHRREEDHMVENHQGELIAIIEALVARTREGKMQWVWNEEFERGTATLINGRVIVEKDRDSDTVVKIQDTDSANLEVINVGYRENAYLREGADELYMRARRSALRVDKKLESILQEISL